MFCKHCGKELMSDSNFCFNCGKDLREEFSDSLIESNASSSYEFLHKWCNDNNLEDIEPVFLELGLTTEDVLVGLTEKDLEKISFFSLGQRKRIINAIKKLESKYDIPFANKEIRGIRYISTVCPKCGKLWNKIKENTGAGNTLGKAFLGSLLLGPIGLLGGAMFGNRTVVYKCNECGFIQEYKGLLIKEIVDKMKK